MVKVANIVFNSMVNDSRVIKESTSLGVNNYKVEVIANLDKGLEKIEIRDHFVIRRFSYFDRTITKSKIAKLVVYLKYLILCVQYCKKHKIIHCNDLNTLPIGVLIKLFFNRKAKLVYDAHEYETEINGLSGLKKVIIKKLEKYLIKHVDKVITVSDSIANEYVRLYGIEKPSLVLNCPNYQKVKKEDTFRKLFNITNEQTVFLYQGGLSSGRGLEILLETFKNINDEKSVIVFMGYGGLEVLIKDYAQKYNNIFLHDAVSPDVLLNYTASADFGILFYEDTCLNHKYCSPNKMFEYIMAEIPVIVSNLPEMKKLVENNDIGVVAQNNTPNGLMAAIKQAVSLDREKLHKNIQKVKKIYNWEEQEKVLLQIYSKLDND